MPNDPADLPVSVPPQLFSLKTPMVSTGMVDNFVSETDTMKVSVKIYADGGENFILSGAARFLVEFIRINPPVLWGLTNAQLASLGSMVAGLLLLGLTARRLSSTLRNLPPAAGYEISRRYE